MGAPAEVPACPPGYEPDGSGGCRRIPLANASKIRRDARASNVVVGALALLLLALGATVGAALPVAWIGHAIVAAVAGLVIFVVWYVEGCPS